MENLGLLEKLRGLIKDCRVLAGNNTLKTEAALSELDKVQMEMKLLLANSSVHKGMWHTSVDPQELFENAMHHKSDSNPFEDSGECMVSDGYSHCEKSIQEYFKKVFFNGGIDGKITDFKTASMPLIKYLNENHNPHVTAIITATSCDLSEGIQAHHKIFDFVAD